MKRSVTTLIALLIIGAAWVIHADGETVDNHSPTVAPTAPDDIPESLRCQRAGAEEAPAHG